MYYVKVLDGLLFVSHWKGNFSFNGVFFRRVSAKTIISHSKCQSCGSEWEGGGEPIRSIFTLEWKLREDPTLQIISHSPSIGDFIQSFHLLASQLPPNMRMSAAATKVWGVAHHLGEARVESIQRQICTPKRGKFHTMHLLSTWERGWTTPVRGMWYIKGFLARCQKLVHEQFRGGAYSDSESLQALWDGKGTPKRPFKHLLSECKI